MCKIFIVKLWITWYLIPMLITNEIASAEVVEAFRRGRIVAHPAETMYGLGVSADDRSAIGRLRKAKDSAADRGFIVLISDPTDLERVARWTEAGRRVARRFWPGPMTLVLPGIGSPADGADATVAVRCPADSLLRSLVAAAGGPIVSTSANRAGNPPSRTAAAVVEAFGETLAVVVDGGPRLGKPSTVVDATGEAPRLLREGAIPWKEAA